MKKALAIAPYSYLPYSSGGQKFIALFFEHLGRETDLTVITIAKNDFKLAKSYKVIPLLKKSFYRYVDTTLSAKIVSLVKKEKFDFVIWEHPYYAWVANTTSSRCRVSTSAKDSSARLSALRLRAASFQGKGMPRFS